jgi:DMSO/TMAO reductase YedYZ molybdopterin-dependent catalytic subunit
MRPDGYGAWAAPSLVGGVVAVPLLRAMTRRLEAWEGRPVAPAAPAAPAAPSSSLSAVTDLDRRRFLAFTAVAGLGAVVVAIGSRAVSATGRAVAQARSTLRLPAPAKTAPPIPAGAELGIDGLTPYVTSNDTFYRIDTALIVPQVDPDGWSLRITGMVDHEVELSWKDVLALPLEEHDLTLACVSNTVGGDLIGNARWLGYPLRHLLARAGPQAAADMVLSRSVDGFTAGTPLEVLTDPGRASLLAIGMNGEPLPLKHGFPARLVVPGLYGYVSATKWVTELTVTRFADARGYWTDRGWSVRGPVRTESRIDTPSSSRSLKAGTIPVAGVAWDQHTGIAEVEVQVDDGPWQPAELAEVANVDTWRQWVYRWNATPGEHRLRVRATNQDGTTQTSEVAPTVPSGATGWDAITVTVS